MLPHAQALSPVSRDRTTPPFRRRTAPLRAAFAALLASVALLGALMTASAARAAAPAKTDILLLFDTTGSMGGALSSATAQVASMVGSIDARLPDVQYGVAEVRDYPIYDDADEAFAYRVNQPMTADRGAVASAIGKLVASGGGDAPEAYGGALHAATAGAGFGWRTGARRLVVLVADELPHDDDLNAGIPASLTSRPSPFDTGIDPGPDGIIGTGDDIDWQPLLDRMAHSGITLMYVLFEGPAAYLPYWQTWSGRTGGAAVEATDTDLGPKVADLAAAGAAGDLPPCPAGQSRNADGVCAAVPPPSDTRHPTSVQVMCNRGPNPGDGSICTATVGDGSTTETPARPTGTVKFTALNGGGFPFGDTCSLAAAGGSPAVASCAVRYTPKRGSWEFPDIVADYSGGAKHQPSRGATTMIFGRVVGLDGRTVVTEGGPATADGCQAAADAATGPAPTGGARAALQRNHPSDKPGATLGDWLSHCTWSTVANLSLLAGYVTEGASIPVGVAVTGVTGAIAVVDPEPVTKVAAGTAAIPAGMSAGYLTFKVGESLVTVSERELRDPPDPKFTVTAKPRTSKRIRVTAKHRKDRRRAALLSRFMTRQQKIAALGDALGATIDKAGGAKLAGSTAWEGKQMRLARRYAKSLTVELIRQRRQARAAARAIRALPGVNFRFEKKWLTSAKKTLTKKRKAKREQARALRRLGARPADIRSLLTHARAGSANTPPIRMPKDLADLVGGRDALRLLDLAITAQRYWVVEPSVLAAAALR